MLGVDMNQTNKEKRKNVRIETEIAKKKKYNSQISESATVEIPTYSSTDESEIVSEESDVHSDNCCPGPSGSKRSKKSIMTPRLCAALDKCKVSDRDAVHLLSAFIESVSLDPALYVINRTSIKNARQSAREENAENVRSDFLNLNVDFSIIHWDGKVLSDSTGPGKVDRLPIIVTGPNFEQLLGVPQIPSGTGLEMSSAIFDTLEKWSLLDKVQGFKFDMTSSNTGQKIDCSKTQRVENLNQLCEDLVEEENVQYKLVLKIENVREFLTKKFPEYLLNHQSPKLFKRLGINTSFLEIDPTEWKNNIYYQFGKKVVDGLHIVNDTVERVELVFFIDIICIVFVVSINYNFRFLTSCSQNHCTVES
ncbi:hypothetical protein QTP88_004430 [Uroleucon formosanum]